MPDVGGSLIANDVGKGQQSTARGPEDIRHRPATRIYDSRLQKHRPGIARTTAIPEITLHKCGQKGLETRAGQCSAGSCSDPSVRSAGWCEAVSAVSMN